MSKNALSIRLIIGLGLLLIVFIILYCIVRQVTLPAQNVLSASILRPTGTQNRLLLQQEMKTIEAAVMQTHFALIETWTPQSLPYDRPPTNTLAPFMPGIYDVPFVGEIRGLSFSNRWQDFVKGERIIVYVGARVDQSSSTPVKTQGIVIVKVYSKYLSNNSRVVYEAPDKTGMLKIVAADGYRLTLLGQNGETLYFDVPTRQFVSSLDIAITAPTTTPLPPITPTDTPVIPLGYPPVYWNLTEMEYPQPATETPISSAQP